jgi:hypothetical protein
MVSSRGGNKLQRHTCPYRLRLPYRTCLYEHFAPPLQSAWPNTLLLCALLLHLLLLHPCRRPEGQHCQLHTAQRIHSIWLPKCGQSSIQRVLCVSVTTGLQPLKCEICVSSTELSAMIGSTAARERLLCYQLGTAHYLHCFLCWTLHAPCLPSGAPYGQLAARIILVHSCIYQQSSCTAPQLSSTVCTKIRTSCCCCPRLQVCGL